MHYILAILCPPLAVLFTGRLGATALNFFLSLLLWLPGAIHACLVVRKHEEALDLHHHERFSPGGAKRRKGAPVAVVNFFGAVVLLLFLGSMGYTAYSTVKLLKNPQFQAALNGMRAPGVPAPGEAGDAALPGARPDMNELLSSAKSSIQNANGEEVKKTLGDLFAQVRQLQDAATPTPEQTATLMTPDEPSTDLVNETMATPPVAPPSAEDPLGVRTWRDLHGRSIQGKFVNATIELIVLEIPGHGTRAWPRSAFSAQDNALADSIVEARASGQPLSVQQPLFASAGPPLPTSGAAPGSGGARGASQAEPDRKPGLQVGIKRDFVQLSPDGSQLQVKDYLRLIYKKSYRPISWGPLKKQEDGNFTIEHTYSSGSSVYAYTFVLDPRGNVLFTR